MIYFIMLISCNQTKERVIIPAETAEIVTVIPQNTGKYEVQVQNGPNTRVEEVSSADLNSVLAEHVHRGSIIKRKTVAPKIIENTPVEDPTVKNNYEEPVIDYFAIFKEESPDFSRLLKEKPLDPNNVHIISYFVKYNLLEEFKKLLEDDIEIAKHEDSFHRNVLHFIAYFNNIEAFDFLLTILGTDELKKLNKKGDSGKSPQDIATGQILENINRVTER